MSQYVWGDEQTQYFYQLTPDHVLNAAESLGYQTTGRVLTLNSMENRVYEVEIDLDSPSDNPSDSFIIFKFYRPGRWNQNQIQDEHDFLWDLKDHELPVIAPLKYAGQTLFQSEDKLWYAAFPKQGGRAADEWTDSLLEQMGRLLARLHNVGKVKDAQHRIKLDVESYGIKNLEYLLNHDIIPPEYRQSYETLAKQIFTLSTPLFDNAVFQRTHGDCHHGNTLLGKEGPYLIDFDDMVMAPKVQDIWMVTPGRDQYSMQQRKVLLDAYQGMADFDMRELKLIESLRSLRMIHFTAWIAHRHADQAFQRAFPNFGTAQYWEKELFDLREQIGFIQDNLDNQYYP
jgi:Ser/Thr protein kinase RdoA (MazF antagonist)